MKAVWMFWVASQSRTARAMNSGPLSERMKAGAPYRAIRSFRISTIRSAGDVVRGFDVQTLPSEIVDDGQDLERSSIFQLIENEVVAPDMVLSIGAKLHDAFRALPEAPALLRPPNDLQPFFTADPSYTLAVHFPRAPTQLNGQPAVAVPRMLPGQFDDPPTQAPVSIAGRTHLVTLC